MGKPTTGYSKAIQASSTLAGVPVTSYVLGLGVVAQSGIADGTAYLLIDGHGSTRALADTAGAVVSGQTLDYDAFGDALDFAPAQSQTTWLFGGDGTYDAGDRLDVSVGAMARRLRILAV